jgi:Actinobacteria/chloroflexi VLRF1 release factor
VSPDRLRGWLTGFLDRHGATSYEFGPSTVALIGADGARCWIEVPFAPAAIESVEDLLVHVERTRTVGALLVRRGGYAAGVFGGTTLISSKVGSSYVQGTTKAGGWSQQRYARRRDNQASAAFAEAADQAVRILLPHTGELVTLFCGGDRKAVEATLADSRLERLRPLVASRFFAVPDPRLRVLQAFAAEFLAVGIQLSP